MTTTTIDPVRRVPPLGGFNTTALTIEITRVLRNRRTVLFTVVMPIVLYVMIGTNSAYANEPAGSGNVSGYIMISMAVYGAILATTGGGAMVATERAQGWTRQLRLTPLSPAAYIALKSLTALILGLGSVLAVNIAGLVSGKPDMPVHVWIAAAVIAWLGSVVFGAFGLFMGYLLPSENVMQILGPVMAGLAAIGGLWFPIDANSTMGHISAFTPVHGLAELARWPLSGGTPSVWWFVNLIAWFALFAAGAVWRMARDTQRV